MDSEHQAPKPKAKSGMGDLKQETKKNIEAKRGEVGSALAKARRNRANLALEEAEVEKKGNPAGAILFCKVQKVYL